MSIGKDNKLIAGFMRAEFGELRPDGGTSCFLPQGEAIDIHLLKYHTSWDWLMPVVEKIEEKGYNVNVSKVPSIERSYLANLHITPYNKSQYTKGNRLEKTYTLCTGFIKWYNKQK